MRSESTAWIAPELISSLMHLYTSCCRLRAAADAVLGFTEETSQRRCSGRA